MTFSKQWEEHYFKTASDDVYHPHLQLLVNQYVDEANMVLELGCGRGDNITFFTRIRNSMFHGIDGSQSAIDYAQKRFPEAKLHCGDFTKEQPFDVKFDLIVDRAAVAHNNLASIRSCIDLVYDSLKPGGLFVSLDWFSSKHSEMRRGVRVENNTRMGYEDGQFTGVGTVHFSDEEELIDVFRNFEPIVVYERIIRRLGCGGLLKRQYALRWISNDFAGIDYDSALWDMVMRKPL